MSKVLKKMLVEVMFMVNYAVLKIVTLYPHISLSTCQQRNIFVNKMAMVMIISSLISSLDSVNQQYIIPDVVVDYSCGLRVVAPTSRATSAMSSSAGDA